MNILAIDPGTSCGYAMCCGPDAVVSGVWDFSSRRHEGGGMRYLRLRQKLDEMHKAAPLHLVVYEEVHRHRGTAAAHVYGGLIGILGAWCEEHGVPYSGTPVSTIKKYATNRGNADKQMMIDAVRSWGYEPIDDNEADALALLHLTMSEHL